jgi:hypothetical protein
MVFKTMTDCYGMTLIHIIWFSDLPEPLWIGGQSKPNEKWVYYGTEKPIPLPTDGNLNFPPWLCLGKPTYKDFLSVSSWGYGWRVYEGPAAEKFFICAEVPGATTATTSSLETTTTAGTTAVTTEGVTTTGTATTTTGVTTVTTCELNSWFWYTCLKLHI